MTQIRLCIRQAGPTIDFDRRADTDELANSLRGLGYDVADPDTLQGSPRRGPEIIEWLGIFIGTSAGTTLLNKAAEDVYTMAKDWAKRRQQKRAASRPVKSSPIGFILYGPDGAELRRWWTTLDEQQMQANEDLGDEAR